MFIGVLKSAEPICKTELQTATRNNSDDENDDELQNSPAETRGICNVEEHYYADERLSKGS